MQHIGRFTANQTTQSFVAVYRRHCESNNGNATLRTSNTSTRKPQNTTLGSQKKGRFCGEIPGNGNEMPKKPCWTEVNFGGKTLNQISVKGNNALYLHIAQKYVKVDRMVHTHITVQYLLSLNKYFLQNRLTVFPLTKRRVSSGTSAILRTLSK